MANVSVRSFDCDLSGLLRNGLCLLRPKLHIELCDALAWSNMETEQGLMRTSTQSSSSTLPLASTLTCFNVSLAISYDVPLDFSDCKTVDLSTRPGVSVDNELYSWHSIMIAPDGIEICSLELVDKIKHLLARHFRVFLLQFQGFHD